MGLFTRKKAFPKFGDKGAAVKKYQKLLSKAGSSIKVTGEFSIGMKIAIKSFQMRNRLEMTGVIDEKTAKALEGFRFVRK